MPDGAAAAGLRVCWVTDDWDASYRYRCRHGVQQLRVAGVPANVYHLHDPALRAALPAYSVVVLFRLRWSDAVAAVVDAARASGARLVFEIDDLIFDPSVEPLLHFLVDLPAASRREYHERFARLRRTFDACDVFLGTTPALAARATALGKPALVHPNLLPPEYERTARHLMRLRPRHRTAIAYGAGSNTHDRDLAAISPALAAVLARRPERRLHLGGFVELPAALRPVAGQIVRVPYQDWRVYPWTLARCALAVAPVAEHNAFTDGKSALKFFEAGILGLPLVASPTAAFRDAITPGVDGLVADGHEAWVDALERALDPIDGDAVGRRARATVLRRYTFAAHAGRLAELLAPLAGRATGPEPPALSLEPAERGVRRAPAPSPAERARRAWSFLRGRVPADAPAPPGAVVVEPVAPAAAEAVLAVLDAQGPAFLRDGPGAMLTLVAEADGWDAWTARGLARSAAGRFVSDGDDPSLTGPPVAVDAAAWRWLVLRIALRTADGQGTVQLFWDAGGGFAEAASLRVAVPADGAARTLVVDLAEAGWPADGVVRRLRLDPGDAPGPVELGRCVLLADLAACDPAGVAHGMTARHARGAGAEAADAQAARPGSLPWVRADAPEPAEHALLRRLSAPVAALAPGGMLLVSGTCDAATLRAALARVGPSLGVVLDELAVAPDGVVHAALRRTGRPPAPARARVRPIDVVVPIHDARAETVACLESVLAHATGDWRLVPVDDASTDPRLVAWLDALAAREPRVALLRNTHNLGFVGTANRGMRAAGARDVVLLNSDTVVTPGFLDGLEAAAYAGDVPALVSPLSNNATILSVPEWCRPNPLPPGWDLDGFAGLVRAASPLLRPELPTAHGFCMYVPAAVRDAVGIFDEETFGRGFGEENDLCERARAAGFPSRCADDVLVWHAGHASFGAEAADALTRSHFAALHARHPDYLPRVAAFLEANPLARVHQSIQLALRRRHVDAPALLCVLHASFDTPAGGTEHHVRDMVAALRLPRVVVAAPAWDAIAITEVFDGDLDGAVRYRLPLAEPSRRFQLARADVTRALREIVRLFGVGAAHLHQLCGWPVAVWRELRDLGVPFVATFQDFFPVCPNVNLWDAPSDRLCCIAAPGAGPDPEACLRHAFAVFGQTVGDPLAWREAHRTEFRALLAHAERVFFPAQRTHDIIARFHPADPARWVVEPHGYLEPTRRADPNPHRRPLRIALLGEIAYPIKGSRNYEPLIARTRHLPLAWHVFGEAERFGFADRLRALGLGSRLHLHGRYHRDEICDRLAEAGIDLVVFLPPWPETFSYTLSEALIAGVPVVVTDQGALTERVHASGAGIVVRNVEEAEAALTRLVEEEGALARLVEAAQRYRHRTLPEMAAAYAPVYRDLLARGPRPHALDADDRLRLVALHGQSPAAPAAPAPVVLPPALPHYDRAWYRTYVRVAGLVPPAVRRWARERAASRWWRTVRALPFGRASIPVTLNDGLELVERGRGRAAYRVLHDDPAFVFTAGPFRARDVRVIRFAMRCEADGDLFAQVFWSHGLGEAFSEDKSLRIPIVAGDGRWHDYTVVIDESDRRAVWDAGDEIVHLRFDPLNAPGIIELGVFHLCAPANGHAHAAGQDDGARP